MTTCASVPPVQEAAVLRVLLIEDDAEDALLVTRAIRQSHFAPTHLTHEVTLEGANKALAKQRFDVILLDLRLPDGDGFSALPRLLEQNTPVLVLSGHDDDAVAIEAVRRGAQDYLPKDHVTSALLQRAVRYAIERQRLHDRLLESHRVEQAMKDEILSHVSHELRTPLTAVASFVGIIKDGLAGAITPQQAEYITVIERNVGQLKRLISDLMDVARISNNKLTLESGLVDVKACIADCVDASASVAAEKGIEVAVEVGAALPMGLGDSQRTTQVLQNLVDNALKFTPPSGRVVIRAALDKGQMLAITVQDNGSGIDAELLPRLFERLQQGTSIENGSRRGLGLGLWIARELVASMRGTMSVTSEPGKGSAFVFTLPVYTLERLVAEVLGSQPGAMLSLIHVELRSAQLRQAGCSLETARREASRHIESCLLASSDRLIPEAVGSERRLGLFALVRAGEQGAAAIQKRLDEQFATTGHRLQRCGFTASVRVLPLALAGETAEVPKLADMVRQVMSAAAR